MKSIQRTQIGLSLVEMMVALVIGLLVLLGLVQTMGASRAAYQLSAGVARTQENARFAMEAIQRDLRMAGHLGCVNDQARLQPTAEGVNLQFLTAAERTAGNYPAVAPALRFDLGLQGFEAPNTAPGTTVVALPSGKAVKATSNGWSPALPTAIFNLGPIAGSDVVVMRYFSPVGVGLAAGSPTFGAGGSTASFAPVSTNNSVTGGLPAGQAQLFGISDCATASVFMGQVPNPATGVISFNQATAPNKSGFLAEEQTFRPEQATLYRAESVVYYVGVGSGADAPPSLYRATLNGSGNYVTEEIVEGVESLQLLYGMDHQANPAQRPTGAITRTEVASAIGGAATNPTTAQADEWRRVGAVQVGLLMRSVDRAASEQATNQPSVLGRRFQPPANDGLYRSVYESTVALRNRLFGS